MSELTPENPTDLSMQAQVVLLKFLRARYFESLLRQHVQTCMRIVTGVMVGK